MKHTIISWDCTFRNFFNLIDGVMFQEFDLNEVEVIYVEQRTQEYADTFNHKIGLKALADRYEDVKHRLNIKVIYLEDSFDIPYHLGRCNNAGLEEASGEIISVMDGDLLLPADFLQKLWDQHLNNPGSVINLHRVDCYKPVGASKSGWKKGIIDYEKCLAQCEIPNSFDKKVRNKGPMISAARDYWKSIGGYDMDRIWSTSASTSGADVCKRLELATGKEAVALQGSFAVHPWHPKGYASANREIEKSNVDRIIRAQKEITDYSMKHSIMNWRERKKFTEDLSASISQVIDQVIEAELAHDRKNYEYTISGYPVLLQLRILIDRVIHKIEMILQRR